MLIVTAVVGSSTALSILAHSVSRSDSDRTRAVVGSAGVAVFFDAEPADLYGPVEPWSVRIDEEFHGGPSGSDARAREWHEAFAAAGGVDRVASLFPGSVAIARSGRPVHSSAAGPFSTPSATDLPWVLGVDMSSRLLDGKFDLVEGRYPGSASEIAMTPDRAERSGGVGRTVSIAGREMQLVGTIADPSSSRDVVLVDPEGFQRLDIVPATLQYQLYGDVPVARMADLLNEAEVLVGHHIAAAARGLYLERDRQSRVFEVGGLAEGPPDQRAVRGIALQVIGFGSYLLYSVVATVLGAVVFAIGVRRSRHDHRRLVMLGADEGMVRRALRYQAAWTGLVGVGLGVIAGGAAALLVRSLAGQAVVGPRYLTELRVPMVQLAYAAAAGLLAIIAAASWPDPRLDEVTPSVPTRRTAPGRRIRSGGIMLAASFVCAVLLQRASYHDGPVGVMFVVALAGVLIAVDGLVGALGSRCSRWPTMWRLSARLTSRQRGRALAVVSTFTLAMVLPILVVGTAEGAEQSTAFFGGSQSSLSNPDRTVRITERPGAGTAGFESGFDRRIVSVVVDRRPLVGSAAERSAPAPGAPDFARELADIGTRLDEVARVHLGPVAGVDLVELDAPLFRFEPPRSYSAFGPTAIYVADEELLGALELDRTVADALDRGSLVDLSDRNWITPGSMVLGDVVGDIDGDIEDTMRSIDVVAGPRRFGERGVMLVSEERAAELGFETAFAGRLYVTERPIVPADRAPFVAALDDAWLMANGSFDREAYGVSPAVVFENVEPAKGSALPWMALATVVSLMIALAVAALAAVEFDEDVRTMVAVGAPPRTRRVFLAVQTLYQAALAALVTTPVLVLWAKGVASADGIGPGDFDVRWSMVALTTGVVPVLIAVLIGVSFRNGTPAISRRMS